MERPLCRCHGEPMDTANPWSCAVKRRARRREKYHADPASANYTRVRLALKARIKSKRLRIQQLEEQLHAQENS